MVEYNRILMFPLTSTLLLSVLMDICGINYFFILIPLGARLFAIINQILILFNLYLMSLFAQRCTERFNVIHKLLVNRSTDSCNPLNLTKSNGNRIKFGDAIELYEFQVYRHYFKTFYFFGLCPVNMKTFRSICAFILSYMVLLIQTSNNG